MRIARRAALVGASVGLAGCGAIFNGSHQDVMTQSAPDGATVTVNPGGEKSTTPTTLKLARKNSYTLTFSKAGYSEATYSIKSGASTGIIILDVLFTGLIGVIVDAATGDWNKLSPETATAALTKVNAMVDGPAVIQVLVTPGKKGVHLEATAPGVGVDVRRK